MSYEQYAIGVPGQPWGDVEKAQWLENQQVKREYQVEVLAKLEALKDTFELIQYGALPYDPERYPLFALKTKSWDKDKPSVLITGGVHGYETSGVQGAIRFLSSQAKAYEAHFNFVVLPCLSPWGYETINRWDPKAIDPNRSFYPNSPAPEAALAMEYVKGLQLELLAHFDLHETTDTDNSEFRPALGARDGIEQAVWDIPDGFYGVGDSNNPVPEFQKAVIDSVEKVTHIAPADADGKLIGTPMEQRGVINYDKRKLFLCGGFSGAKYVTTTEVYPDSPKANDENCILAQVAAITGGLDYLIKQR
ncbi:M14 family metallocarboxypeptidase [Aliiglaciecola sp. SL4]|uniref:M14 family metallopeptidase n=1 Tax=Aliiglaciecola sp. SL4 TaxID=3239806 RepID=UPI00355B8369